MDTLYLPLLRSRDPIELALNNMRLTDSRAVVASGYDASFQLFYRLCLNEQVVDAYCNYSLSVSDFQEKGEPVTSLMDVTIQSSSLKLAYRDSFRSYELFDSMLDQQQVRYGLLNIFQPVNYNPKENSIQMALIVMRHEGYRSDIVDAKKICYCEGQGRHKNYCPP
jgi:hypothetical protein